MNRTDDTLVVEVEINAPAERIWRALVDPDERMQWWGKGQARTTRVESDLRPGGTWVQEVDAYGTPHTISGVYREVEPPFVLSFTWNPTWGGAESLVRFDIIPNGATSTVRLTHSDLATEEERKNYRNGWGFNLKLLKEHTEGPA